MDISISGKKIFCYLKNAVMSVSKSKLKQVFWKVRFINDSETTKFQQFYIKCIKYVKNVVLLIFLLLFNVNNYL